VPEPQDDQVLIEIAATGICGSDVHYLKHGAIGSYVLKEPMCLGHESSGVVVKLGPNAGASGIKVGQRVSLEPGVSCRSCYLCMSLPCLCFWIGDGREDGSRDGRGE
jgi:L-iditol 2-dehydrogenase/D-xylulose reductase